MTRIHRIGNLIPSSSQKKVADDCIKQVAEKRLAEIISERERERAGILPPKKIRDSGGKMMTEHVVDYLKSLEATGRDTDYVRNLRYRLTILVRDCGWLLPINITPDSFESWRSKKKASAKTKNQFLESAISLLNWMVAAGRINQNPLTKVKKVQRHPVRLRRAFSEEEVRRLIQVSGGSRAGYLLAVHTGLRRGELKSLLWRHIYLDCAAPYLLLDGRFTKNKADAYVPLHPEVVAELLGIKPDNAKQTDSVLVGKMLPSMWKMKSDLKKAGIEYETGGRRVDFHSLRHTFATNLARHNVHPRAAMRLLRHSTLDLTMNVYTDSTGLPLVDAVNMLPRFVSQKDEHTQIRTQKSDSRSPRQSQTDTARPSDAFAQIAQIEELWRKLAAVDTIGHEWAIGCLARTRT